jgi:signal transduction histidine kinase
MPNTGLVSLLRRTYWLSVIAIAAIGATVVIVAMTQRSSDRWTQHSREVVRLARRAQLLALDRETGVRGFLLTGDSTSLAPELAARVPLGAAIDSLVLLTADNAGQQARAREYGRAVERWDSMFVRPAITQRLRRGTGAVTPTFGAGALAGKVLFDDVRMRYARFESEEESLYLARNRLGNRLQFLDVAVTIVGLAMLGGVQSTLRRRVSVQASALVDRQGQLEEQAAELEEQAGELESQTEELQGAVKELGRKNEDLNAFSSAVAHDLRSPLRSIDGFSHVLLSDYAERLDDAGVQALRRIRANAQRMGEMIDGLLSLARVSGTDLRLSDVNLSELATASSDEIRRAISSEREVAVDVRQGLSARADARLVRIAIHNLLENAFKFTRARTAAHIEVGTRLMDGRPAFFVADNGIGFDMRHADRLFGSFERLHDDRTYEGTGIGLATVRRIVERHGGTIWAESIPDRGTTFYFTLPA